MADFRTTSIEIQLLNGSPPKDRSSQFDNEGILGIIKKYEDEYKVFTHLGFGGKGIERKILKKIKDDLMNELNFDIEECFQHDKSSSLMIISAFFGRKLVVQEPPDSHVNPEQPRESSARRDSQSQSLTDSVRRPVEGAESKPKTEEINMLAWCHHPLHTMLVMCFAAYRMEQLMMKETSGKNPRYEKYQTFRNQLEDTACSLIDYLFLSEPNGHLIARAALQADYKSNWPKADSNEEPSGYSRYLEKKFDGSREIMAIAYKAKAMKFLSQRPCKNLLRSRNDGPNGNPAECENHKSESGKEKTKNRNGWLRYKMKCKLIVHAFFRFVYIAIFAYMLCMYPIYINDDYATREKIEFVPFFYVFSVLLAQFFMTVIKASDFVQFHFKKQQLHENSKRGFPDETVTAAATPSSASLRNITSRSSCRKTRLELLKQFFDSNKLAFYRLVMIVVIMTLESIRMFLHFTNFRKVADRQADALLYKGWTIIPIALELLYCVLFAIAAISSLRMFHVSSLGFFVYLFKKMWKTVGMFLLIFVVFWFVLAVIHVSISRAALGSMNMTPVYKVLSEGKFEIFGEVKEEDRDGVLRNCGEFNRTVMHFFDMHYEEASCLFRSSILPFLVFTYMFVAGILLINLLTAQLTKEYETELERNKYYKGYLRYEQISKIESKLIFPPPLSLLYVLARLFSCCDCVLNIAEKMDGYPWGSVRQEDEGELERAEEAVRKYLTEEPSYIWKEVKEIVNEFEGNPDSLSNNLENMKKKLLVYIGDKISEENVRARTATQIGGAGSRMENAATEPSLADDPTQEVAIQYC